MRKYIFKNQISTVARSEKFKIQKLSNFQINFEQVQTTAHDTFLNASARSKNQLHNERS